MEILRCSHLTKIYGSGSNTVAALNDVSFSLEREASPRSSGRPAPANQRCFTCWEG